ncbi:MAG: helix-turn-helix transcriptional regulator [Rhizobiales bacterium]|nr:helix-turn-helix transcriptional regulator [Hyphomicrobiales bacterium]
MTSPSILPLPATVDREVGARIRALRQAKGLSLDTVAGTAGLSIGFLSQIERGLSSPSLKALASLADALGLPIAGLFEARTPSDEAGTIVVHADERSVLQLWRSGIVKQLLTPDGPDATLNVFLIILAPGASTGDEPYSHRGEEAGLVLEGAITLTVDARSWTLKAGDSFRFESVRPHRFANAGKGEARVVWVNART